MSFDLVAWYERSPITDTAAQRKYGLACDGDESAFASHRSVRAFRASLIGQLPALETLGPDIDDGVWSLTPPDSDRLVWMSLRYDKVAGAKPVIFGLADEHGLVCFDPQTNLVRLPAGMEGDFKLVASGGPDLSNPERHVIGTRVRDALTHGGYAILESGSEQYVQAGSGASVGRLQASYAVECRNGSADRHFRFETNDLADVVSVFELFAQNDLNFQTRFPWQKYKHA